MNSEKSEGEREMAPYRKGTPHPSNKHRKGLVPKWSDDDEPPNSPVHLLQLIRTQVAYTLQQIDGLASKLQKVGFSANIENRKVQSFVDSLAEINSTLKEWENFFEMALNQPNNATSKSGQKEHLPESVKASNSIHVHDIDCLCELPVFLDVHPSSQPCTELSKSPLTLSYTPVAMKESTMWPEVGTVPSSVSPLPDTPYMSSPPKSLQLLLANASSSSFLSTPSDLLNPLLTKLGSTGLQTPSTDLLTPIFPPTPHFLLQTPLEFVKCELFGSSSLKTPGFETSPPRTLQPMKEAEQSSSSESDQHLVTPSVPSPFRTPGVSLRFSLSSGSSSDESSSFKDDFTASTVKRLGPKGLEEKLWHELEIRKADILKSFNGGHTSLCSRKSTSTRCSEKGSCQGKDTGGKS